MANLQAIRVLCAYLGEKSAVYVFAIAIFSVFAPSSSSGDYFLSEPIVISDPEEIWKVTDSEQEHQVEYDGYPGGCTRPFLGVTNINNDGLSDFIVHYWCTAIPPYELTGGKGIKLSQKSPNVLVALVSNSDGRYEQKNVDVFGSLYPALDGATRKMDTGDVNGDGVPDFAFSVNWEDGRLTEDGQKISAGQGIVFSVGDGKYSVETIGEDQWGHALQFVRGPHGKDDIVFAGYGDPPEQVFRRLGGDWSDVSDQYPRQSDLSGKGVASTFFGLGMANTFSFLEANTQGIPQSLISSYSEDGSPGWALIQRTQTGWEMASQISFPTSRFLDFQTYDGVITESSTPVYDFFGESRNSYFIGPSCTLRLYPDQQEVFLAPLGYFEITDEVLDSGIVIQNDMQAFTKAAIFYVDENKNLQYLPDVVEEEVSAYSGNFIDCKDVNADGYDDFVVYAWSDYSRRDEMDYVGGQPIIYLNNKNGKLVRHSTQLFPKVESEHYPMKSQLEDINGDDLPDLILFSDKVGYTEKSDIHIYIAKNPLDDFDGDGVKDRDDAFPQNSSESEDSDLDGLGDNTDNCPLTENTDQVDTDGDAEGDACDLDDDNDGFTDEEELADGTNPLSRFSCRSGCFSFDIDENSEAKALTDGLLVIRHLFGFTGDALATGAISTDAMRDRAEDISALLTDADSELDIDGNGESKALSDGLLLIRYLFGFTGDALTVGAIGEGATRDTSEAIEAYISDRVPAPE